MALAKRPLYKRERRPARAKGMLKTAAPLALPDATANEIAMAIFALCKLSGVIVGRGGVYDTLKDEYTVTGKSLATGVAQDWQVTGQEVAEAIMVFRVLNGGKARRTLPARVVA